MTSCLETGRSWDSSSCSCLCPPSKTCSGGQVLDPSTCGCLLKEIQEVEEREERSEGQEDPLVLKWEYPMILTLASLNLLLVSIIVVLARRHHKLRIRIKKQPRSGRLLILLLFWYCYFPYCAFFYSWSCIIFIFCPQPPTQPLGWQPVLSPPWQGGGRRKGGEISELHPAVLQ